MLSLAAAAFLLGSALGAQAADPQPAPTPAEDSGYSEIATFAKAIELIRQDYVDGEKVSYHDLIYAAMKGMLSSLDPHSQFMDPDDFKDMQDDTRSRFNGLGVEVALKDGILTVVTPMEGTPAAKAGDAGRRRDFENQRHLDGKAEPAGCGRCAPRRARAERSRSRFCGRRPKS